jgi:4-hydroxy-tetrahydrodipicolinate reductase
MAIRVCLAGVTGAVGRALLPAVLAADDLTLVGAVSRSAAGRDAGEAVGQVGAGITVAATVGEALETPADVLIDYTAPSAVKGHTLDAVARGVAVVVGTSGLTAADYDDIDARARAAKVGVVASGNFSLTAALVQHFALIAASRIDHWEVIDYGKASKSDAPSGTARELAEKLGAAKQPLAGHPVAETEGARDARGATIAGVQTHSLRLPGFASGVEVIFGMEGERLSIRHDAITHGAPYVAGSLLAARRVPSLNGLVRGLDTLLF